MLSRRKFIQNTLTGLAVASFAPTELFANNLSNEISNKPIKLTILHTNDMHSRIDPFPLDGRKESGFGGMARRATLVKKIRSEQEHTLLLDCGDVFQGTPYFNYFGGELEFRLMSEMGYDAGTLGNHDFDNGLQGLQRALPAAKFPILNANYDFSKTILKDKFQHYKVFNKGGIKIGIFGVGIELNGIVPDHNYAETVYKNPVTVAKQMVATLKSMDCQFIICLSHLGYSYEIDRISDMQLAAKVDGIDLILGGHTHTFLEEPTSVKSPNGDEVLINQVGWAGLRLGRIDVVFDKNNKKEVIKTASIEICEKIDKM